MNISKLRTEIEHAINCNSAENGSDTPDFILAEYLTDCLAAYDRAVTAREKWYGREPKAVDAPDIGIPISEMPNAVVTHAETCSRTHGEIRPR